MTSQYADTFFRAQGTKTAPFGQVQDQGAPRLSKVNITHTEKWSGNDNITDYITPEVWSKLLWTGITDSVQAVIILISMLVMMRSDQRILLLKYGKEFNRLINKQIF